MADTAVVTGSHSSSHGTSGAHGGGAGGSSVEVTRSGGVAIVEDVGGNPTESGSDRLRPGSMLGVAVSGVVMGLGSLVG